MKSQKIVAEITIFGLGFFIGYMTGKNDLINDIIKSINNKKP
jgi:hypothetical protein